MVPRVVITGMGVVSPNGIGKEAFCRALLAGKSGVKRISRFDPSSLPVHIAGEIPEFDELAWVDARERKHVSRVVPLAVAASTEAIQGCGPRSRRHVDGREARDRRDSGHGRRRAGIFRRAIPALAQRTRQASQPLLHSERHHGDDCPAKSACASDFAATATWSPRAALLPPTPSAMPTSTFRRACCRCFWWAAWIRRSRRESSRATRCCGR